MTARTLRTLFIAGAMVWMPTVASAQSLNDSLQTMFDSWGVVSTATPGAYESQSRGYLAAGAYSIRLNNDNFSLWNINPPRFRRGCAGIDTYLGSFSYAKLSRYVDMLQQFGGSVVLGYAFQLAMKELCETCSNVLNMIETASRSLNALGRIQPCQAGQEVGEALAQSMRDPDKLNQFAYRKWQQFKTQTGITGDPWEDRDSAQDNNSADAAAALKGTEYDITGNLVWNVLKQAGVEDQTARIIMSTTGTIIVNDQGQSEYHPPTIKFSDLIDVVPAETVRVYACTDDPTQCLQIQPQNETAMEGFKSRTATALQNIVTNIYSKTAMSAADVTLVNMSPIPVLKILTDYGHPNEVATQLVRMTSEVVAIEMAIQWMEWAVNNAIQQGAKIKQLKPSFAVDTAEFRKEAHEVLAEAYAEAAKRSAHLQNIYNVTKMALEQGQYRTAR